MPQELETRAEEGVHPISSPAEIQEMVRSSMQRAKTASRSPAASPVADGTVSLAICPLKPIGEFVSKQAESVRLDDSREDASASSPRESEDQNRLAPPETRTPAFKVRTEDGKQTIMTRDQMNEYVQRTVLKSREEFAQANKIESPVREESKKVEKVTKRFSFYKETNAGGEKDSTTPIESDSDSGIKDTDTGSEVEDSETPRTPPISPLATPEKKPSPKAETREIFITPQSSLVEHSPINSPRRRFSWSSVEESQSCDVDDDTLAFQSDMLVDKQGQLTVAEALSKSNTDETTTDDKSAFVEDGSLDVGSYTQPPKQESKPNSPVAEVKAQEKGLTVNTALVPPRLSSPKSDRKAHTSTLSSPPSTTSSSANTSVMQSQSHKMTSTPKNGVSSLHMSPLTANFPLYSSALRRDMESESSKSVLPSSFIGSTEYRSNQEHQGSDADQTEKAVEDNNKSPSQVQKSLNAIKDEREPSTNITTEARQDSNVSEGSPLHDQVEHASNAVSESNKTEEPKLSAELDGLMNQSSSKNSHIPFDEPEDYMSNLNLALSPDVFEGLSSCDEAAKKRNESLQPIAEEGPSLETSTKEESASIKDKEAVHKPFDAENESKEVNQCHSSLTERYLSPTRQAASAVTPRVVNKLHTDQSRTLFGSVNNKATSTSPTPLASPLKRVAAVPPADEIPPTREDTLPRTTASTDNLTSSEAPNEVLILMSTLSDVQRDEKAKVEIMKRNPVGVVSESSSSSSDSELGNDACSRRSARSSRSNRSNRSPRKRSSPKLDKKIQKRKSTRKGKQHNDDDSKCSSARRKKRKSSRKSNNSSPIKDPVKKSSDEDSKLSKSSSTKSSVVVNDELLKAIASKKGSVMTADELNNILVNQRSSTPIAGVASRKSSRHKVTITRHSNVKKPGRDFKPTSLLAKSRGPSKDAFDALEEEYTLCNGFASKLWYDIMDLVDFYTDPRPAEEEYDDETTLEDISSPREWIGSVLDFGQAPSSTIEETVGDTETENEQGVFDKLAEELHTIIEVSSESDIENTNVNQSFSFSQGEEDDMSHSVSNTDNEIEPGWYKKVSKRKKKAAAAASSSKIKN